MSILAPNTGFGAYLEFTGFEANVTAINGLSFDANAPEITHLLSTEGWAEFFGYEVEEDPYLAELPKKQMGELTIETIHNPTDLSIIGVQDELVIHLPLFGTQSNEGTFTVQAVCMSRAYGPIDIGGDAVREAFVFRPTSLPVYAAGS